MMKKLMALLNLTRKGVRWLVLIVILLLIAYGYYILFIRNPYTTDAFVQGNWIKVASRVEGPIVKIFVNDNQEVKKGQALFQIDPTDYELKVRVASGKLAEINQNLAALQNNIKIAEHLINEKKARLQYAQIQFKRFKRLTGEGAVSDERYNSAMADFVALTSELSQATYKVKQLQQKLGSIETNGSRLAAIATLALDKKRLSYTIVRAHGDGRISNFYARIGDYIKVGVPVFSIVEKKDWWIQANYLEYELRRIRRDQKASIIVSMYPDHSFEGVVSAIGAGISRGRVISAENTLPIVKESINWLRLFSRFPVYIHITNTDAKYPLRVGATAVVAVHVK